MSTIQEAHMGSLRTISLAVDIKSHSRLISSITPPNRLHDSIRPIIDSRGDNGLCLIGFASDYEEHLGKQVVPSRHIYSTTENHHSSEPFINVLTYLQPV